MCFHAFSLKYSLEMSLNEFVAVLYTYKKESDAYIFSLKNAHNVKLLSCLLHLTKLNLLGGMFFKPYRRHCPHQLTLLLQRPIGCSRLRRKIDYILLIKLAGITKKVCCENDFLFPPCPSFQSPSPVSRSTASHSWSAPMTKSTSSSRTFCPRSRWAPPTAGSSQESVQNCLIKLKMLLFS